MSINFSVRWADNTKEFTRNLKEGLDQIEVTRASVDKLSNSLSGTNVTKSANNWAAALQKVGGEAGALAGIQKLTTAEIDRAIGVFDRAISKAEAMGKGNTALVQTYREMSSALHKASDEAEAASQTHKTFGATVEGLGISFTKLVAAQLTAQAILGTIEGGFRALAGGISASVKAASDAEHAHTQITAALKAQGNAVPSVVKAYLDYADALQKTTIFQDDAIEGAESLLVQVGNVMPRDMKKALTATTELASGLGKDLNEAAMLVAKAAEGNTTALRKAGVVIDETTAKSGDFGKVLDAITAKFGGQAAAIAGTYEGRLIQLGNTWNNVEESIGRVITQNATVLRLFDVLNQRIADNTGELKDNAAATNLVSDAVILTVRGVALLADAIDFAQTGATAFFIGLRRGGQAIGDIGILALEAAKGFALMQGNMSAFSAANEGISSLRAAVNDLGERNQAATNRSVAFGQALDTIKQRAGELATDLEKTRGKTVELSTATDTGTDAWNKHTKAVIQAGGAQDKFASAMAELASVGQDWQATIDTIDGSIVEAIKFYLEAGISQETLATAYALTGAQLKAVDLKLKDHTEALKIADDIAKKFTEQGNKNWKEWQASTKKALDDTNKLVVSTFEGFVKAQRDYRDAVAQDTLSADDLARHKLQDQLDDAKVKLRELGESFRSTYDLIEKTVEIKLDEIGTLWKEHPMIPPKASFDAKVQINDLSGTLNSLSQSFVQLSQISGDTFGGIAKDIGIAIAAASQMTTAVKAIQAIQTNGNGNTPANILGQAAAYTQLATAVYSLAQSYIQASIDAAKARNIAASADQTALSFQTATHFSDQLNASILKTRASVSGLSQVDLKSLGVDIDGAGEAYYRTLGVVEEVYAQSLNLVDIIKELGGVAGLTADQLATVQDRLAYEFRIIALGGADAVRATTQLDGVLTEMGTTAAENNGLVDKFFLAQAAHARELGITLKGVNEFMSGQAANAESGIGAALKVGDDAYKKRIDLMTQIADLTEQQKGQTGSTKDDTAKKIADLNAQLDTQNKIIDATAIHSQAAADAVSGGLLGIINSQIMAGKSFHDSVLAIAPAVDALSAQMIAGGFNGGAAFDNLRAQVALATDAIAGPALTAVEGYAAGLVGLNNAGLLNQDTFAGLSSQIGQTEAALVAQGKDGNQVMSAMRGPLQTMWELEQKFGYTTDEATQKLIDQAAAQGLVGESFKPIGEQMLDATNRIADAVEGLAEVFGVLPKAAADAADGITAGLGRVQIPTIPPITPGAPTTTGTASTQPVLAHAPDTAGMMHLDVVVDQAALTDGMSQLTVQANKALSGLKNDLSGLPTDASGAIDGLAKALSTIHGDAGESLEGLKKDLAGLPADASGATDGIAKELTALQGKIGAAVDFTDPLGQAKVLAGDALEGLKKDLTALPNDATDATAVLTDTFSQLQIDAGASFDGLKDDVTGLPKDAKTAADGISDELAKIKIPTIKIPVSTDITYNYRDPAVPSDVVYAHGGKVKPYYMAVGGGPVGTDTVPAWLTPGEGVITKTGMNALDALNTGRLDQALQPIQSMIADDFRDFGTYIISAIHQSNGISGPVLPGGSIGVITPTTTIASGSNTVVLQEQFTFNVSIDTMDAQNLSEFTEKKMMPGIMTQIEDRRRGFAGRLRRALELPIT